MFLALCFSGIPKFTFTDESMSWEGGKDGVGRRQRWCGEEAEMVWGGGRDGVGRRQDGVGGGRGGLGRRQRWCGEEAEMVWGGGRDGVARGHSISIFIRL